MVNRACPALAATLLVAGCATLRAEERKCEEGLTVDDGLAIRSWTVESRWGTAAALSSAVTADKTYSPEKVSRAVEQVRDALRPQIDFDLANHGGFSVLYVGSCVRRIDANRVDVVISPFLIRVDLLKIGSNVLPVPHFNHPASALPPRDLAQFNPVLGLESDRRAGVSANAGFSTDLLHFGKAEESPVPVKLRLDGDGSKAFDKQFYAAGLRLAFSHERPAATLRNVSLISNFESARQPLGEGDYLRNALRMGGMFLLSPAGGAIRNAAIGGNYRWSVNRAISAAGGPAVRNTEKGFEFRAITDARVAGGMARVAGWADGGYPNGTAYQRGVFFAAYAIDIPVARNQTFGVEALFGAGGARGAVPPYARFFGGNEGSDFLYEGITSVNLASVPLGPLLRSYGRAQAGGGAASFWNTGVNVSVPIPKWSKPLIPALDTPIGQLSDVFKRQALHSAKNFLTAFYKQQGAPSEQAAARADGDLREIRPAVKYLADYANLIAVKPLFMFDAASLDGRIRQAAGGGVQITIVVARFEAGYMRTVNPLPRENRGNFIMRLTFENLF